MAGVKTDYVTNKHASLNLARQIQWYWRRQGYPQVQAWVEPIEEFPGHWAIRSNIKFGSIE